MTELAHVRQTLLEDDFGNFETDEIAYIKTVTVNGKVCYAVYDAEGTPLNLFDTRDIAFATIKQNEMEPISAH